MYRYSSGFIGFVVTLSTPVITSAASGKTPDTVHYAGPLFFLLFAAWGFFKCFSIARRQTTNTKCAVALGLSLIGYFIVTSGTLLKGFFSFHSAFLAIFAFLGIVLFVVSSVLAIIGLLEYKKGFNQGKKQAIWAMVLNGLFTVLIFGGLTMGIVKHLDKQKSKIDSKEPDSEIVNADLNFRLEMPYRPYIKLKPSAINPYAKAALMRTNPKIYYMLIAERGGVDIEMSTENLLEVAQANVRGNVQKISIGPTEPRTVSGMDGLQFKADAVVRGKNVSYQYWVCSINGFLYQQIAFGEKKHIAVLHKDADQLFTKLKQVEPEKVCYSIGSDPFGHYQSPQFGYSLDLHTKSWTKWTELTEKMPAADTGGLTGNETAAFIVSVLPFGDNDPGPDAIIDAFLQSLAIKPKDKRLIRISDKSRATHNEYVFKYSEIDDGTELDYKIKILTHSDRAYLLAVWSDKEISPVDKHYAQIEPSLIISNPDRPINIQQLDRHGKIVAANILNRVGLYFDDKDNHKKASVFFMAAVENDPTDKAFWDNLMSALNQIKDHEKAVAQVEKYKNKVTLNNSTLSWHAWHLTKTGQKAAALKVYQDLFATSYDSEEDFKYYIKILAELDKHELIDAAYDTFLKNQDNVELRIHQADIWFQENQNKKALAVLEKLDPNSSKVILEKIFNYRALGQHKEILLLCDQLIDNNQSVGNAYFHKGKAEYDLKWYAKSKNSFEKSLASYPKDQTIKDYLKELSGILGQGDNSIIKTEIEPVPLPESIAALSKAKANPQYTKDESVFYLQHFSGYQHDADGILKNTIRRKIRILNSTGANNFSTFTIDFNPLYEQLYVNSLVVRNSQDEVIAQGDADSYYLVDLNKEDEKTHDQTLNMPIPQLTPGCTFEIVATKILGNYDSFPFRKNILASRYPIAFSMAYILGDTGKIHMKGVNGVRIKATSDAKIAYIQSPFKYRREPQQASYRSMLPMVYICGIGTDWRSQGQAYLKKIQKQMVVTDDIKKLSRQLTKGIDKKDRKVEKIYRYLQDNYKYMGIEFGSRGEMPYAASRTVKNKYGDCKDHAVLFHHLLKAAGIPNYLALVNSRYAVQQDMPSREQFNHIINYIPGEVNRFFDATDKDASTDLITPTYLGGLQALVLEPDNVRFVQIPDYKIEDSSISVRRQYHIEDQTLSIKETLQLEGYHAVFMRNFLKSKNREARRKWGQATLSSYYPSAELDRFAINGIKGNNEPLTVELDYSISRNIHALKDGLVVNTGGIWEPYYLYVEPVNNRQTKFEVEFPFSFASQNTFKIPDGFAIEKLPKPRLASKTDFGTYETKCRQDGERIQLNLKLSAKDGIFPKGRYQAYYRFNQKIIESASPNLMFTQLASGQNKKTRPNIFGKNQ